MNVSSQNIKKATTERTHELVKTGRQFLKENSDIGFLDFRSKLYDSCEWLHYNEELKKIENLILQLQQNMNPLPENIQQSLNDIYTKQQVNHHFKPHIAIIGAGLAGLFFAVGLCRIGFKITLAEKREFENNFLRPQNISFKFAERYLREAIGEELYQLFFTHGAFMDGATGKLRITIGAFQDVMYSYLKRTNVDCQFASEIDINQIQHEYDYIIVATGSSTYLNFNLEKELNILSFPEYSADGLTALYLKPSSDPCGYSRVERDGYHWHRENTSINDHVNVQSDIKRLIQLIKTKSDDGKKLTYLDFLLTESRIDYCFIFGNKTDEFYKFNKNAKPEELIWATGYHVLPLIALNNVIELNQNKIIVVGDANGIPHPLAAIGTLKFIKNFLPLAKFINAEQLLKNIKNPEKHREIVTHIYQLETYENIFQVYWENLMCCIYSEPRK